MRPTYLFVDLDNLLNNVKKARAKSKATHFMGIVKAQAYGNGAIPVAKAIEGMVDYFGVATVEEGIELRKGGIKKPIAVLGGFYAGEEDSILDYNLEPAVFKEEHIKYLSLAGKRRGGPVRVHLKVDTGLGRLGIPWNSPRDFAFTDGIEVVSAFTTLSSADNSGIPTVREQNERMKEVEEALRLNERGVLISMANSAGLLFHPEIHRDLVRPGILLYGIPPVPQQISEFRPIMKFVSKIVFLKRVNPCTPLGYGGSYVTRESRLIATVPAGYDDGIPRCLSNKGWMYVRGQKAPIVGKISMDLTLLDVSDIQGVKEGDEVVVFSDQAHIWEISKICNTIPYEIMCRIGKRVHRRYIDSSGKELKFYDF